ncbi:sensor histidine kinase [Dyadobacter frigoris]|uniref:GHKL domain-containing protein n=1 Tax=Dyadobacter frigoris TaxID=2576211 RepID=A0A4V6BJ60_9BACT|nr:histidine kinase [Dyadobacter frigoris]TKT85723.1 GHKL domain-containing protein [Dyadobacter frigoris]
MDDRRYRFLSISFRFENEPLSQKILMHGIFWLFFLGSHLLYFVPAFRSELLSAPLRMAYLLHYLRMIPIFYCYEWIFYFLQTRVRPFFLYTLSLISSLILMHIVTSLNFLLIDHLYGLINLSPTFYGIGSLYIHQTEFDSGADFLIFSYDMMEMQLLFLPLGLKMAKYGNRQNALKLSAENEVIRAEIKNLRATLAPHLIYNMINAAYAQVEPVSKQSAFYLRKLSDLLRYNVYDTRNESIPLQDELYSIQSYLELEKVRRGTCPEISFEKIGIVKAEQKILSLILFTLTENAFKHCVGSPVDDNWIRIVLSTEEKGVRFQISNSKPVKETAARQEKYSGIGLVNIERILEHNFPGRYKLQSKSFERSFEMELYMPFIPDLRDELDILT